MPEVFFFGKILRRHGLEGDWIVQIKAGRIHEHAPIEILFIEIEGLQVPFFVERWQMISRNRLLISFSNHPCEDQALERLSVYFPLPSLPPGFEDRLDQRALIGFSVEDRQRGPIGIIMDINEQSSQKRFDISFQGKQIWVPIVKEFIVEIYREQGHLLLDCPEGLLDLYI